MILNHPENVDNLLRPIAGNPAGNQSGDAGRNIQRPYWVTGYALSYNIGVAIAIAGGIAPLIVSWLIFISHDELAPA